MIYGKRVSSETYEDRGHKHLYENSIHVRELDCVKVLSNKDL